MKMCVKNQFVTGQVWIHFFIGDTMGFNTWLGHYNSSSNTKRPYRDCHCNYSKIGNPNMNCTYVTLDEMRDAKRRKMNATTAEEKNDVFKSISKHDIHNALT